MSALFPKKEGFKMANPAQLNHAAAAITAALIQRGKANTAALAATLYFDCLARLAKEEKGRDFDGNPKKPSR